MADAKLLLTMVKQFLSAAQHAGNIGTHLHVVLAQRLGAQHGVVADHVAHLQLGQINFPCDVCNRRVREIAQLILRVKQHGDKERPLSRILLHLLIKEPIKFFRYHHKIEIAKICNRVFYFPRAVCWDAVKIAVSCRASLSKLSSFSFFTIPASLNSSIHNMLSSASST